ncbi:MAG: hypothetical protein M1314_03475 [Firmicutes bacterium]|nr:hypothetical protein [Bacillota bacterium]
MIVFMSAAGTISFRKFGLEAERSTSITPKQWAVALRRLQMGVAFVERELQPLATDAARSGHVALANRFGAFDLRYHFFRAEADGKFGVPLQRADEDPSILRLSEVIGNYTTAERSGSYLSGAMIDVFFSRLEHMTVLMLPFLGFDASSGELLKLIRSDWDEKYKAVLDISADKETIRLYDELKKVKECFRNPLSHGGFEKGWWSLYLFLPRAGTIPGSFTDIAKSMQFNYLTIAKETHAEICALFNAVDAHLGATPGRAYALEYVRSELNVGFDEPEAKRYQAAMSSRSDWDEFLQRKSYLHDQHANMDY